MSENASQSETPSLNIGLIFNASKYYAIIEVGFGLLTMILLNRFAGGGGIASGLFGGLLIMIIYAYTGLTGPILAAVFAYHHFGQTSETSRSPVINSGIANAVGYIVFGAIVATMSALAFALGADPGRGSTPTTGMGGTQPTMDTGGTQSTGTRGGGSMFAELIGFVILMSLPSGFVGAGMEFISGSESTEGGAESARISYIIGLLVIGGLIFNAVAIISEKSGGLMILILGVLPQMVIGFLMSKYKLIREQIMAVIATHMTGFALMSTLSNDNKYNLLFGFVVAIIFVIGAIGVGYYSHVAFKRALAVAK